MWISTIFNSDILISDLKVCAISPISGGNAAKKQEKRLIFIWYLGSFCFCLAWANKNSEFSPYPLTVCACSLSFADRRRRTKARNIRLRFSTNFLYFDFYLSIVYAAHYVYFTIKNAITTNIKVNLLLLHYHQLSFLIFSPIALGRENWEPNLVPRACDSPDGDRLWEQDCTQTRRFGPFGQVL